MSRAERLRVVVAGFSALMVGVAVWETAYAVIALAAVLVLLVLIAVTRWVLAS